MAIVHTTTTSPVMVQSQSLRRITHRSHQWIEPLDILVLAGLFVGFVGLVAVVAWLVLS